MSTMRKVVRVFSVLIALTLTTTVAAYAGGWGRGPSIAGYHPLDPQHPIIPAKPLDGAKDAVNDTGHAIDVNSKGAAKIATDVWHGTIHAVGEAGTVTWQAVKRPFVETWKFLSDPTAGLRRKAEEFYHQVLNDATDLAYKIVKWASIGFGAVLAFAIGLAMGLAALLFRPRRTTHAHA